MAKALGGIYTPEAVELRRLMAKHKLTRPAVAAKLGVCVAAVDAWLTPITARSHNAMPRRWLAMLLEDLEPTRGSKKLLREYHTALDDVTALVIAGMGADFDAVSAALILLARNGWPVTPAVAAYLRRRGLLS